jgi:molecular chaperone HscA
VRTKELRSGIEQQIEVTPQYGLTDNEVEKMLLDSIQHAKEDMVVRAVVEAKTEALQLMETTRNFIQKNANYLQGDEVRATDQGMKELGDAINTEDKNLIHEKIEELNKITRPFAERIMDIAIGIAMKGKKV